MTDEEAAAALAELLVVMKQQVNNADQETAHIRADEILVSVLQLIAPLAGVSEQVEMLLADYKDIDKWYA